MPEFDIQQLIARLPDSRDGKMPPADPAAVGELCRQLIAGGPPAVSALVASLRDVEDGADWKPRFLLHALVIQLGSPDHDPASRVFVDSCLAELGAPHPLPVKTFLLHQLRWLAGPTAVPKILPLLGSPDPPLADAAAAALVAIGQAARQPLAKASQSATGRHKQLAENCLAQLP